MEHCRTDNVHKSGVLVKARNTRDVIGLESSVTHSDKPLPYGHHSTGANVVFVRETYRGCALLLAASLPLILNKVKVFLYTKLSTLHLLSFETKQLPWFRDNYFRFTSAASLQVKT